MPYVAQVAVGTREHAAASSATTTTRPTAPACATTSTCSTWPRATWRRCGTCSAGGASLTVNLGTGRGYSVLEVVQGLRGAPAGGAVPYRVVPRGGRATWPRVTPTRALRAPAAGLAGTARAWTRCARTAGAGSATIRDGFDSSTPVHELTCPRIAIMMTIHLQPVVMAGGSGTRLWPLSRSGFPKQFLVLTGRDSLFQQAVRRLAAHGRAATSWPRPPGGRQRGAPLPACSSSCANFAVTAPRCCWSRWGATPRRR